VPQYLPADIVNRALDAIGHDKQVGSLTDGTKEANAAARIYVPTLVQLLRAAHWNFARKQAALTLLGDVTGQSTDPLTGNPLTTNVESPWIYAYAWPNDGVAARWLPWTGQVATTSTPLMTNLNVTTGLVGQRPARFLVSSSDQYPTVIGAQPWDQLPDLQGTEGVGYQTRKTILTNVPPGPNGTQFVYTRIVPQIEEWDGLFSEALVAVLASRLAMPILDDKKFALAVRNGQIQIAKDALMEARTHNANDAGFPQSLDHVPDWIRARRGGSSYGAGGFGEAGMLFCSWSSFAFADGSVF
jgi:hypothetical protein